MSKWSDWIEENPVRSGVSYTILIIAATASFFLFVLDENKINHYKAIANNAHSEVNHYKAAAENARSEARQYEAKISVLEKKLSLLTKEKDRYLRWLTGSPDSFPALEKKIKELESKLASCGEVPFTPPAIGNGSSFIQGDLPYAFSKVFYKGESFKDPKTKATIGVNNINTDHTADGILYLPYGNKTVVKNVKPGEVWGFTVNGTSYNLTLDKVNWLDNSLKASVMRIN